MKHITSIKTIVLLIATLITLKFSAQEIQDPGAMVTDRPDQTESPSLVTKGYVQVETGGFYTQDEDQGFKTEAIGYNTTLVRYGLLDNLELRLGLDFVETRFSNDGDEFENKLSGFSPMLLGVKVGITEEKGALPQIGLLGHLRLPFTAGSDYKPETTGADFRFSFAHTLSEKSSLSYNLGAQWGDDSPEIAYVYTLVYGYSITDKIGAYVELYGDLPENNSANHLWDTGFTYLLKPNVQLDATIGSGLNTNQDLLVSAGVSFRLPK
jgi:hypothetical protein